MKVLKKRILFTLLQLSIRGSTYLLSTQLVTLAACPLFLKDF